ncbi:hypothetical protein [Mycobacterium simiae]|uniref:Phage major capsid protein n=1 Tax=Mycobacterium simiae TaxID=1784 RepID=A0A1X0XWR9_MYCSI|nr:hypothetical protein [Mycobacterium simiae]ORJ57306.1 hypothetical protein B5M45_22360 [Mycobacterium simiae]
MYLSAERLALANQAVKETFEQCSIVWQAIPHWDTGDPGQITVADGKYSPAGFLSIDQKAIPFVITLAEANAPTPDLLLTQVMATAKDLAQQVDDAVLPLIFTGASTNTSTGGGPAALLASLIKTRARIEDAGYRAPSCIITNTEGLLKLSQFSSGVSILGQLTAAANVNSLYRTVPLNPSDGVLKLVFVGRRRRIPQGGAPQASPGEEPVDLAVALPPSLEVDGETGGNIQLTARIRYAKRITDANGLAALHA